MKLHRMVIAIASASSVSLGSFSFAQSSQQPSAAPESQTMSQEPASSPTEAPAGVVIIEIQQRLAAEGHDPGAIDGVWGPQTEAAVRDFQRANDMNATGQLDQETIAILLVPVETGTEEAAGAPQAGDTGAADQQTQQTDGGSSADQGAPGQSPSQGQQQGRQ